MSASATVTVRVPLAIHKRGARKLIISPDGSVTAGGVSRVTTISDPALVKALARAFRWKRLLDEGHYVSITDISSAEKIDRGYVGSLLRLTLLAPDIIQLIVEGRQHVALGLPALLTVIPVEWTQQREMIARIAECSTEPSAPHSF